MADVSIADTKFKSLKKNFVHFSKKSSITRFIETFCIDTPYDERKLMNGAIT